MFKKTGKVVKLLGESGIGYVRPDDSEDLAVFTFDKIVKYGGENPKELGLRTGTMVEFDFENRTIKSLRIIR
jgi:hypothetical protein